MSIINSFLAVTKLVFVILNLNREDTEVYRVMYGKYDIFSISIEFLTTNDLGSTLSRLALERSIDIEH